jgi:hypothetical protein
MRFWVIIGVTTLVFGCSGPQRVEPAARSEPALAAPTPSRSDAGSDAGELPTEAASPAPIAAPEIGPNIAVVEVRPGHYAGSFRYHNFSSCSRSWSDYTARTSFVMDLGEDGVATACRGRRIDHAGPDFREAAEEQQGFRGPWRRDGDAIEIQLALDDAACPQRRGYTNLEPLPWHMRCRGLAPTEPGAGPLPGPVLACQFATRVYTEELGYALPRILSGEWMLLGDGHGVQALSDYRRFGDEQAWVRPSSAPVLFDEWTRPFGEQTGSTPADR